MTTAPIGSRPRVAARRQAVGGGPGGRPGGVLWITPDQVGALRLPAPGARP